MTKEHHILFVDDEPAILQSMRRLVRQKQPEWKVHCAKSVRDALAELKTFNFDAVISDIKMPGQDGFDLLHFLHSNERTRNIPVVMVTGLNDRNLKRRALELGATDLLNKPVEPNELLARVGSVLQLKAYQDKIKTQNEMLEQKVQERTSELEDARIDLIWRLGKAGEYRDSETGYHVIRVGYYSRTIAEAIRMDKEFTDLLFLTSPLHDIGKIGIPDSILLKAGPLNDSEWHVMKQHCLIGAELLGNRKYSPLLESPLLAQNRRDKVVAGNNPFLKMAKTIALSHHERWRGGGYPDGLKGNNIPLEARIVILSDIYDALLSERPYKPAFSEEKALHIMAEMAGDYFDPEIYQAFLRVQDSFRAIRAELQNTVR